MEGNPGIIFAADVEDRTKVLTIISQIGDIIDGIKIGYPLVLHEGLDIIADIKQRTSAPVIADFKVMDIPYTARKIAQAAQKAGCDYLIVCGQTGPSVIEECIATSPDLKIFVFTEFTHADGLVTEDIADDCARVARDLGAYGIQVPGTKLERIRSFREIVGDLTIISCGVGAQGADPREVIEAGADFVIVGRAIYNAENPYEQAIAIRRKIEGTR